MIVSWYDDIHFMNRWKFQLFNCNVNHMINLIRFHFSQTTKTRKNLRKKKHFLLFLKSSRYVKVRLILQRIQSSNNQRRAKLKCIKKGGIDEN